MESLPELVKILTLLFKFCLGFLLKTFPFLIFSFLVITLLWLSSPVSVNAAIECWNQCGVSYGSEDWTCAASKPSSSCEDNYTRKYWVLDAGDCGSGESCYCAQTENCPGTQYCENGECVEDCVPDCAGKECGDDGCGGSCGSCGSGEDCIDGDCVACSCSCSTMFTCGTDGCALYERFSSCGCSPDECCTIYDCYDECVSDYDHCCDSCADLGYECGTHDDGCGGTVDCGSCGTNEMCDSGECVTIDPIDCASSCSSYSNWQCTPESCDMIGWPYTGGCSGGTCYYGLTSPGLCSGGETCCCWNEDPCDCNTNTCDDTGCNYGTQSASECSSGTCQKWDCDCEDASCSNCPDECDTDADCSYCGDGNIDANEECDPAASPDGCGSGETCTTGCTCETDSYCGDGTIDDGEECDSGIGCDSGWTCDDSNCDCYTYRDRCWEGECVEIKSYISDVDDCDTDADCSDYGTQSASECSSGTCQKWDCDCEDASCSNCPDECDTDADCSYCGDGNIDANEECDPAASPDGCGSGETCTTGCTCETDSCVCDGCVDAYDCGPKTFYGDDCPCSDLCSSDDDCEGCGDGSVDGPEECDPPGSTTSCTMPNGCPGTKICSSSCTWGSCTTSCSWGYCPHNECDSYCPSPNCVTDYSCGYDDCSSDYGCSDGCSPNTTSCTGCIAGDGCEGKQDCDSQGCLSSCYRDSDYDCCSGSSYCPYADCYGGDCLTSNARGCGTDQCSSNSQCRHNECETGFCEVQYDNTANIADDCSNDGNCRHYECETNCPDDCDANCNCDEDACLLQYDDQPGVSDECCQGLLCPCTYGESEGYECTWATDRYQCCEPSCPTEAECSSGAEECCGQGDGCDGTCSDCDVSDGDLDSPENLSPGTGNSSLPQRIRTSNANVLDPSALSQTLTWADGDVGNGCDGSTRTDSFPFRLDKDPDSWSGDCSSLNAGDECGEPDVSSPSYTFSADIGSTYHWWVHARNETCASYTDCCGDSYTGVDDWSVLSDAYVCRPDCRPALCGQNDNCGAEQTLEGFNGFDGADDDCPANQNGNPDSGYRLRSSLDGINFYESSGISDPAVLDPESPAQISRPVTLRWEISDPLAQDVGDEVQIEIYRVGDPATDPNWTSFDWGNAGVGVAEVGASLGTGRYNYGGLCGPSAGNPPNVCTFTYNSADHHIVYGWRAAHHNVTCETIDSSGNVGEAFGQVDTLDPDGCNNDELCGTDGERDWSVWAEGYFIVDNLPTVISINPKDGWSGGAQGNYFGRNPENQYYDWDVDTMPAVWEWEDPWTAPSDKPVSYCQDNNCEDIALQNNPAVFEVVYEDRDGWRDFHRLHFTFNSAGQDCVIAANPSGDATVNRGRYTRLERPNYETPCPSDGVCADVFVDDGGTSPDWTLLEGKIERVNDFQIRGYFKVQFNNSSYFLYHGGQIKLCADSDDFHTADDETRWLGDPYGGPGSWNVYGTPGDETDDWWWKVDMRAPELNIDSDDPANGNEIKDLMMVDVDGSAPPCDPATQICDRSIYDTWAYEVQIGLREFNFTADTEEDSGLYSDTDSAKLAPDSDGDGVVTLDEREADSEEPELSVLAWYWNNYDEGVCEAAHMSIGSEWEWIRLDTAAEAAAKNYPFYYEVDSFGTDDAVVTLYVPAEDEDEEINGMCYQRTREVMVQIKDAAGNVHDRSYSLFPGWLQAVNGDLYSRSGIDFAGLYKNFIDQDLYDPFLLASEPLVPNGSGPCGDQTSGGIVLAYPGAPFIVGGDLGQGAGASERPDCKDSWVDDGYNTDLLTNFEEMLGFDWVSLHDAAVDSGNKWEYTGASGNLQQISPGDVYIYDSYDETANGGSGAYVPLEGEYKLNGDGVAVIYVGDGDGVANSKEDHLFIGDGDSTNETSFYNSSYNRRGVIIIVEGGVKVADDIERVDAFIISLGALDGYDESIVFPITKYVSGDPLIVHGSLVAAKGFDISRYIFDIYEPVLQVRFNSLYQYPGKIHSLVKSANHNFSWVEEE